jgi:hypothetical protein
MRVEEEGCWVVWVEELWERKRREAGAFYLR